jgi:integrase/recombinase XerD
MHVLRHTAAMRLLKARVDTSTIALWLGDGQERRTHIYVCANLALEQRTLDRITPPRPAALAAGATRFHHRLPERAL